LTATPSKSCTTNSLNASVSTASTAQKKAKLTASKAKQAASELVYGKEVNGKDKYGRTLADVLLDDGTNLNQELVKQGWCWWYRKYAPGDTVLEGLETEAREAKKGLWVDPAPVAPWIFRYSRKRDLHLP
jgi:micrococcal nuclease